MVGYFPAPLPYLLLGGGDGGRGIFPCPLTLPITERGRWWERDISLPPLPYLLLGGGGGGIFPCPLTLPLTGRGRWWERDISLPPLPYLLDLFLKTTKISSKKLNSFLVLSFFFYFQVLPFVEMCGLRKYSWYSICP